MKKYIDPKIEFQKLQLADVITISSVGEFEEAEGNSLSWGQITNKL